MNTTTSQEPMAETKATPPPTSPTAPPTRPAVIRPPRIAIIKAPGLLPMLYTPSELAEELGLTAPTIRDWLKLGLPHERDERGYIWINGRSFAAWLDRARRAAQAGPLAEDEAYCVGCRRAVKLNDPICREYGKRRVLTGICPACGRMVNRGLRHG
jgi:hypothetical protein